MLSPRLHLRARSSSCVGVVYDRMHTREIAAYGGLVVRMPVFALVFMLFTLGNVGLPGTSGFVGEFLTLAGAFQVSTWVAFFAATGVILSALLCALALPPGGVRRSDQGEPEDDPGHGPAREADLRAADRGDARCSGSIRRWCSTPSAPRWRR